MEMQLDCWSVEDEGVGMREVRLMDRQHTVPFFGHDGPFAVPRESLRRLIRGSESRAQPEVENGWSRERGLEAEAWGRRWFRRDSCRGADIGCSGQQPCWRGHEYYSVRRTEHSPGMNVLRSPRGVQPWTLETDNGSQPYYD